MCESSKHDFDDKFPKLKNTQRIVIKKNSKLFGNFNMYIHIQILYKYLTVVIYKSSVFSFNKFQQFQHFLCFSFYS